MANGQHFRTFSRVFQTGHENAAQRNWVHCIHINQDGSIYYYTDTPLCLDHIKAEFCLPYKKELDTKVGFSSMFIGRYQKRIFLRIKVFGR